MRRQFGKLKSAWRLLASANTALAEYRRDRRVNLHRDDEWRRLLEQSERDLVRSVAQLVHGRVTVTEDELAWVHKKRAKHDDWEKTIQSIFFGDPMRVQAGFRPSLPEPKVSGNGVGLLHPHLRQVARGLNFSILDIGAQNLESENHIYAPLYEIGPCRVAGFEPLEDERAKRKNGAEGATVELFPDFIGDGSEATFYETRFNPASSTLEPNKEFLREYYALPEMLEVVETHRVQTRRLDDINAIGQIDFLKIDVQGGELNCLKGASKLLETVLVIDVEMNTAPLYKGQGSFSDIDTFVRGKGFWLCNFRSPEYLTFKTHPQGSGGSRLSSVNSIYVRDIETIAAQGPDALMRAAIIAHMLYSYWDLASYLFSLADKALGKSYSELYNQQIRQKIYGNGLGSTTR